MLILSVDPGYDRLGLAVLEGGNGVREKVLYTECFSPSVDKNTSFDKRCLAVGNRICQLIKKYSPDILAIENIFFNKNQKTALQVSEIRGIVIYEAAKAEIKVAQFSPLQVKVAITGYGRSDKRQVENMINRIVKIEQAGKLKDDEYDAIAIGLTALYFLKVPSPGF